MGDIVLVSTDEWEGLYINGKNVDEGHSLSASQIVELLGGTILYADEDWLIEQGYLPENLSEVKLR